LTPEKTGKSRQQAHLNLCPDVRLVRVCRVLVIFAKLTVIHDTIVRGLIVIVLLRMVLVVVMILMIIVMARSCSVGSVCCVEYRYCWN
jgi:hypothetical protein